MKNLLEETLEVLKLYGKSFDDVLWIGSHKGEMPKDVFLTRADKEYNEGFGSQAVYPWLKIVGDSWWLERHEYDGSEWWEFKALPKRPAGRINFLFYDDFGDDYAAWYHEVDDEPHAGPSGQSS